MSHDEQVERTHAAIARFVELAMGRLATMWADQNLSVAQIGLLFVLANAGSANVRYVAERLRISQSAASLLVDRLVQAGLAERSDDPADRRRVIVRLTAEGEALMGRNDAGRAHLNAWLREQDDATLTTIRDAFDTLQSLTGVIDRGEPGVGLPPRRADP